MHIKYTTKQVDPIPTPQVGSLVALNSHRAPGFVTYEKRICLYRVIQKIGSTIKINDTCYTRLTLDEVTPVANADQTKYIIMNEEMHLV